MGILFVIIGLLFSVAVLYDVIVVLRVKVNGEVIEATVIENKKYSVEGRRGKKKSYEQLIVSYKVGNMRYETSEIPGIEMKGKRVGDVIAVVYQKNSPDKIVARDESAGIGYYGMRGFLLLLGIGVISLGVYFMSVDFGWK